MLPQCRLEEPKLLQNSQCLHLWPSKILIYNDNKVWFIGFWILKGYYGIWIYLNIALTMGRGLNEVKGRKEVEEGTMSVVE